MQFTFDKRTVYETVFRKQIQQLGLESLLFCDIFKHFVHKTELYDGNISFAKSKTEKTTRNECNKLIEVFLYYD